jgi:hypothetical protein
MTGLTIWTVIERPTDYPEEFIARKWVTAKGLSIATGQIVTGPTLQSVRDQIPPGLYRLPRAAEDDPKIVESWF